MQRRSSTQEGRTLTESPFSTTFRLQTDTCGQRFTLRYWADRADRRRKSRYDRAVPIGRVRRWGHEDGSGGAKFAVI